MRQVGTANFYVRLFLLMTNMKKKNLRCLLPKVIQFGAYVGGAQKLKENRPEAFHELGLQR